MLLQSADKRQKGPVSMVLRGTAEEIEREVATLGVRLECSLIPIHGGVGLDDFPLWDSRGEATALLRDIALIAVHLRSNSSARLNCVIDREGEKGQLRTLQRILTSCFAGVTVKLIESHLTIQKGESVRRRAQAPPDRSSRDGIEISAMNTD